MLLCHDWSFLFKVAKTISRNAHYMVAFRNPRDQVGMRTLALQADWLCMLSISLECAQRPFSYSLLDSVLYSMILYSIDSGECLGAEMSLAR